MKKLFVVGVAIVATLALSSCAETPFSGTIGKDLGYVSGDGTVTEFNASDRVGPVSFDGPLDSEGTWLSDDYLGKVVVVNFWYAGCAPCRVEAPILEEAHQLFIEEDVVFIGVNLRDQAPQALAFAEKYGVTYPSILDIAEAKAQFAFAQTVPANAVPSTLVLDRDGKVAARVLGAIDSTSILRTLIQSTLDEN